MEMRKAMAHREGKGLARVTWCFMETWWKDLLVVRGEGNGGKGCGETGVGNRML